MRRPTSSDFDRIPPGVSRRAAREGVFGRHDQAEPGRAALFSDHAKDRVAGGGLGSLALRCSRCDGLSPLTLSVALRASLPLVLIVPWREHPVFALCPACGYRSWLRFER